MMFWTSYVSIVWSLFLRVFEVLCGVYFSMCLKYYVEFISHMHLKCFLWSLILLLSVSGDMVNFLFVRYFFLKYLFVVALKKCLFFHEVLSRSEEVSF